MDTLGVVSTLVSGIVYLAFLIFCLVYWWRGITGRALLLAALSSVCWLGARTLGYGWFSLAAESLLLTVWLLLVVRALGLRWTNRKQYPFRHFAVIFAAALSINAAVMAAALFSRLPGWLGHLGLLVLCMLGLVLIEQFARNTRSDLRWRTRYLNIGLGIFLTYNLIHHAIAVTATQAHIVLYQLQLLIYAGLAPMVVIASLRNRQNQLQFSLSRNFAFQTGMLVTIGTLLTGLALFSYIAQLVAGDLGLAIGIFSLVVGTTLVFVVVGSSRLRRRIRVLISKTFFEYRYDYREEWMEVTARLTEPDADFTLAQQAQRAIMDILQCDQSGIWRVDDAGQLTPIANIQARAWHQPISADIAAAFINFYSNFDWVLERDKLPKQAQQVGKSLDGLPFLNDVHYLAPLIVEQKLFGIVCLGRSQVPITLGWEDYDIIKLVAKQSAGFLAFQHAARELAEQEQLSAMNQMSAFLVHDLKTITAQLSLMLENANKHRNNPAFIDDMLKTTQNSVERMQHIIHALRQPADELNRQTHRRFSLDHLVNELLRDLQSSPVTIAPPANCAEAEVIGSPEQIQSAIRHLVQNAVDAAASGSQPQVSVTHEQAHGWAILTIIDNGPGMSATFIEDELFSPFKTRKGIKGMGIGAYQARSIIRQHGGDLEVHSIVNEGSQFVIRLPLARREDARGA